ncbi:unnamed protein product [Symbiodinium microadriaticum]|nr:unnamed protein product [Symbiodinium microadriaticum]
MFSVIRPGLNLNTREDGGEFSNFKVLLWEDDMTSELALLEHHRAINGSLTSVANGGDDHFELPKDEAAEGYNGSTVAEEVPVGKAGNKQRRVLRESIQGITKPAIRRLARRGGVKRISGLIYEVDVRGSEKAWRSLTHCDRLIWQASVQRSFVSLFFVCVKARTQKHVDAMSPAASTCWYWYHVITYTSPIIAFSARELTRLSGFRTVRVMCGILALFGVQEAGPLRKQVVEAAKLLRHRGPDWSGVYCEGSAIIAHERLAIVDPDSGDQPLYNEAKDIVLGVNGEIYNYEELQKGLEARAHGKHRFLTKSDCEVLLHLYAEDGIDFMSKNEVCGMYAFAIWDKKKQSYIVARDPVGIIPLYIGWGADGSVQVASELKALHKAKYVDVQTVHGSAQDMQLETYSGLLAELNLGGSLRVDQSGMGSGRLQQCRRHAASDEMAMCRYLDLTLLMLATLASTTPSSLIRVNMHSSKLFEILKKDGHNVLGHIPSEEFREMRRLTIDLILHTDKYCHRDVVEDIRILARQGYAPKSADPSSEEGAAILQVVMRAMLLTADLSNQCRSLDTANAWAAMLQQELGLQDEQERELGLQVLPLNRWKPALADLQLHLGMTRTGPLLGAWVRVFPALAPATMQLSKNATSWAEACMTQNEVEGASASDERAKKIEAMLDPARPAPTLGEATKGHDRFGYLAAARPYIGRQQVPASTLSSLNTASLGSGSATTSQPETAASPTNQQPPPLVREVRRWKEGKGLQTNKEFPSSSKGRELVLLYVLSDPSSNGKPLPFQFVDRNSASLSESAAADVAVAKGVRAASDDVQYDRKRRMSCFDGSPGGQMFQTQRSADAVSTVVEPGRFDDVLSSLLHGNIVIPHTDHGTGSSPMMSLHPGRASRTSQVVSEISAATRDRAMMAASVFGVLLRGDHSNS